MYHFFFSRALDEVTQDALLLYWDASFLTLVLFHQPPRIPTALWDLGCSVPALVNLQAQEEARTNARRVMFLALEAAESSAADDTDQPDFPYPSVH